jgi:hypothetical protein
MLRRSECLRAGRSVALKWRRKNASSNDSIESGRQVPTGYSPRQATSGKVGGQLPTIKTPVLGTSGTAGPPKHLHRITFYATVVSNGCSASFIERHYIMRYCGFSMKCQISADIDPVLCLLDWRFSTMNRQEATVSIKTPSRERLPYSSPETRETDQACL